MQARKIELLTPLVQEAVRSARRARLNALPPVSGFQVGACVITSQGELFVGANVEEPAVNGTVHAESAAMAAANAAGQRDIGTLVLCAAGKQPVMPCMHCQQFLAGYAEVLGHDITIISVFPDGDTALLTTFGEYCKGTAFSYADLGLDVTPFRP